MLTSHKFFSIYAVDSKHQFRPRQFYEFPLSDAHATCLSGNHIHEHAHTQTQQMADGGPSPVSSQLAGLMLVESMARDPQRKN